MIFRTLSDRTTDGEIKEFSMVFWFLFLFLVCYEHDGGKASHTLIFANVFQGERKSRVFSLDDSNFAKGTTADDSKQAEVVEVHYQYAEAPFVSRVVAKRISKRDRSQR
jgi:hypothetical protein